MNYPCCIPAIFNLPIGIKEFFYSLELTANDYAPLGLNHKWYTSLFYFFDAISE